MKTRIRSPCAILSLKIDGLNAFGETIKLKALRGRNFISNKIHDQISHVQGTLHDLDIWT